MKYVRTFEHVLEAKGERKAMSNYQHDLYIQNQIKNNPRKEEAKNKYLKLTYAPIEIAKIKTMD